MLLHKQANKGILVSMRKKHALHHNPLILESEQWKHTMTFHTNNNTDYLDTKGKKGKNVKWEKGKNSRATFLNGDDCINLF